MEEEIVGRSIRSAVAVLPLRPLPQLQAYLFRHRVWLQPRHPQAVEAVEPDPPPTIRRWQGAKHWR